MALTIISAPEVTPVPTPVSDCLQWCFQPDDTDIFSTPGSNATVEVEFPDPVSSIPVDGTTFVLWGRTFTIDSSRKYTSTTFKVESDGEQTADNFRRMLMANFFFSSNTYISVGTGGLTDTLITWNTCGEQDNFTGGAMDYAALTAAGATVTVTNGVTPVLVDGAMIQVKLKMADAATGAFSDITLFEGIKPSGSCDVPNELCIDFMRDAKRNLYTPIPDLTTTSEIDPEQTTMIAYFKINTGVTFRDDNCQPQSGTFTDSDPVLVMDTVFDDRENLRMRRYIYDHPENLSVGGGQPAGCPQFLTNKPQYLYLGENSFAWLWLAGGYQSLAPTVLTLRFNVWYANGTTGLVNVSVDPILEYQVHCFNVSPGRLIDLFSLTDLSNVVKYAVMVTSSASGGGTTIGWQTFFVIEHSCQNLIDVYFKTPPGGIGTILCEITDSEINQEGTEICLSTPCGTTRQEVARYGGRMLNNIRSYEKVTLRARRNFSTEEVEYFKSVKASPERWIQVSETGETPFGGSYIAKRLIVEPGGVKVFQSGEYIDLVITGTIGDIPVQTPRGI